MRTYSGVDNGSAGGLHLFQAARAAPGGTPWPARSWRSSSEAAWLETPAGRAAHRGRSAARAGPGTRRRHAAPPREVPRPPRPAPGTAVPARPGRWYRCPGRGRTPESRENGPVGTSASPLFRPGAVGRDAMRSGRRMSVPARTVNGVNAVCSHQVRPVQCRIWFPRRALPAGSAVAAPHGPGQWSPRG